MKKTLFILLTAVCLTACGSSTNKSEDSRQERAVQTPKRDTRSVAPTHYQSKDQYYQCINCWQVLLIDREPRPNQGKCKNPINGKGYGYHDWRRLATYSSSHVCQCEYCGLQLNAEKVEEYRACPYSSNRYHNFSKKSTILLQANPSP